MPRTDRPAIQPVALSMDDAARALGITKPVTYDLIEQGLLRTFLLGRRRLTTPDALRDCVSELERRDSTPPSEAPNNRHRPAATIGS